MTEWIYSKLVLYFYQHLVRMYYFSFRSWYHLFLGPSYITIIGIMNFIGKAIDLRTILLWTTSWNRDCNVLFFQRKVRRARLFPLCFLLKVSPMFFWSAMGRSYRPSNGPQMLPISLQQGPLVLRQLTQERKRDLTTENAILMEGFGQVFWNIQYWSSITIAHVTDCKDWKNYMNLERNRYFWAEGYSHLNSSTMNIFNYHKNSFNEWGGMEN